MSMFLFGIIGLLTSVNLMVCSYIVGLAILAIISGQFLENAYIFAVFGTMFLIEIVAIASSAPLNKLFNKTYVQIFVILSRIVWTLAAVFVLYKTIYNPLPVHKVTNSIVMVVAVWLLINNISGIIYRAMLCFPNIRKRLINASEELEQKINHQEAPK